jgi:hypothetical protein
MLIKLIKRKPLDQPLSEKKLEANRRNARKSTGPSTPRGRAVSSQNARKYHLLPFENPKLPAQLAAQYYGRFIPGNKNERRLVDMLIHTERVRRYCVALEARLRRGGTDEAEAQSLARALVSASRRLSVIPHFRDAADSSHHLALRQLEAIKLKAA